MILLSLVASEQQCKHIKSKQHITVINGSLFDKSNLLSHFEQFIFLFINYYYDINIFIMSYINIKFIIINYLFNLLLNINFIIY